MKRYMLLTFLVFSITTLAFAKGPMDKIIITTPDDKTIEVTDPELTKSLSMASLEIFSNEITEPKDLGDLYVLKRQIKDNDSDAASELETSPPTPSPMLWRGGAKPKTSGTISICQLHLTLTKHSMWCFIIRWVIEVMCFTAASSTVGRNMTASGSKHPRQA